MRYQVNSQTDTRSRVMDSEARKVLTNTYWLLGMTLAFSGLAAFFAMSTGLTMHPIIFLVGAYGLMFLTHKLSNSGWGLVSVFAFTGFMGLSLGPIISAYLGAGMGDVVTTALSMTALVFFGLSAVALITKKDFSFLGKFLMIGFFVLLGGMIASFFISGLHLVISAGFVIFASAAILFETSQIVHGGQRNYILATISLFVAIYNLFLSLLTLLGMGSND
ncbi:BAX inhibitor protein [Terasakiispira papahanaumokuakeensis]|uniref:BAX inhibitor protein n=1 Tax=Terasakiispira papahanaumokuakeensis TaxID=197479 RepID=A0A1E2V9T9_9GAMM|nr:Bax inhibitor-1/YccA family protein [Terasakiispira papahanaumokuakeensis]ODC03693.1 BAX inhibitor protein [Terasakiispira papahanaumokuakeensis]